MDGQRIREWESRCVEEQPPACIATCPVRLDVRAMLGRADAGDWRGALAVLVRAVPFPGVLGRICDAPCEGACRRAEAGGAVRIRALERAVLEFGGPRPPPVVGRSLRKMRVAVVGAGLGGLAAAVDLALKGCAVTVFEAGERPLGRLYALGEARLPARVLDADLAVLGTLGIDLRCRSPVDAAGLDELAAAFDGVYLGVGAAAASSGWPGLDRDGEGRVRVDPVSFATGHPKIFAGGSLLRGDAAYSPVASLSDGRHAALSLDRMFQGASLTANRERPERFATRLYTDVSGYAPAAPVAPADPDGGYAADEARAEAGRCFPCRCMECVKACEYLASHKSYPKRYVREIYNNDCIVLGNHKSNRLANACSLCGLCEAVCPERLNMGEICLEARESMVDKGKMPPSYHDFALRDMAFSTGERFFLARHQPGMAASAAAFFPGCQLSASAPERVEAVYAHLRGALPGGVGLMLGCCGAPAHWAGRSGLFRETRDALAAAWEGLGRPRLIAACPTCRRMLETGLPEARVETLWTILAEAGVPARAAAGVRLAIHDPCAARDDRATQRAVRRLLAEAGASTVEIDDPERTTCCGFGGLASFVDPGLADRTVDRRIARNDADYVTYCAMCRDNFARRGKRAVHVLDLLFGDGGDAAARPDPGFSRRQENRARLKARLLRTLWEEPVPESATAPELIVFPEVAAALERRLILHEDVRAAIRHAEATGEKIVDARTGHCIVGHRPVGVTYWIEYARQGEAFVVYRAYSHRMQVAKEIPE